MAGDRVPALPLRELPRGPDCRVARGGCKFLALITATAGYFFESARRAAYNPFLSSMKSLRHKRGKWKDFASRPRTSIRLHTNSLNMTPSGRDSEGTE